MKAEVGDIIRWSFDNSQYEDSRYKGKTFSAKVAVITDEDYGVYAPYGQDYIAHNKATVINTTPKDVILVDKAKFELEIAHFKKQIQELSLANQKDLANEYRMQVKFREALLNQSKVASVVDISSDIIKKSEKSGRYFETFLSNNGYKIIN